MCPSRANEGKPNPDGGVAGRDNAAAVGLVMREGPS
jgi:hypothetical protein